MERTDIMALLPHRDPFLFVDRVVEIEPGERAVAIREVKPDEPWFAGHFPGDPILPGVLIAEALAQVAALVYLSSAPDRAGSSVYLVGMDKMRFRKPVRPGATLRMEVAATRRRMRMWMFEATATVDGERVADGNFMATVQGA